MQDKVWLGTQESFDSAVAAIARLAVSSGSTEDPEDSSVLVSLIGSCAVINIEGSLLNRYVPAWALDWGVVGYDNIREALTLAASNTAVDRILLTINSNGGSAAGVEDLADYITKLQETMPIYTFTGGAMNSAAYWLGCLGDKIFATKSSIVGSIGAYQIVYDESKALEDAGIKGYVVRFGDNKALINGVEPISKEALTEAQKIVTALGSMFVDRVAMARGVTPAYVRSNYGDGSVFLGVEAHTKGMVTDLGNFDSAVSAILSLPSRSDSITYRGAPMKTSAQAAHTPVQDLANSQLNAGSGTVVPTTVEATVASTITYLEGKLDTATKALNEAEAKLATYAEADSKLQAAEAATQAVQNQAKALADIVASQLTRMATALNTPVNADVANFDSLVAVYNAMAAKFESRLPVGGLVNHNTRETEKPAAQNNVHPLFAMQAASAATSDKR